MKISSKTRPRLLLSVLLPGALLWNSHAGRAQTAKPPAPAISGQSWLNTPKNQPISLQDRRGKVTVVEFWTFGCSNCRANLGSYAKWARDFKSQDVAVIGIHTPETAGERDPANVARMVKDLGIAYPVVLDGDNSNWNRWKTRYWPTVFVLDRNNRIRAKWEGELDYQGAGGTAKLTQLIQNLLAEK